MEYTSVTALRWADEAETLLDCVVDFVGVGAIPFTASATDTAAHSQDIFSRAVAGDFGAITAYEAPPAPEPVASDIDAERDRRIAAGFEFSGKLYQSRPEDRENIAGASTAALAALVNGAQPGDLRWHGGDSDFCWIAADNSLTTMDAQTMFAFGQAAMAHKQAHIFAARAVKDMEPIPADYTDNKYWP